MSTDDEILEPVEDFPLPPQPVIRQWQRQAFTPAPTPLPDVSAVNVWVIPKPQFGWPSVRTLFELTLVLALLWSLFGRGIESHVGPTPPLPPGPNRSPLVAALVWDVTRDGFATSILRSDATLPAQLKVLNTKWEVLDKDDPKAAGYLKGNPTPVLSIVEQGKTDPIAVGKAPATSAEVISTIKSIRGER